MRGPLRLLSAGGAYRAIMALAGRVLAARRDDCQNAEAINRRRPRRRRLWIATAGVGVLLVAPVVTFVQAMAYPGSAPTSVRAVEWVRDHGGGPVVDRVEVWWYSHNQPPRTGAPQDGVSAPAGVTAVEPGLPTTRLLPLVRPLAGEGSWTAASSARGVTTLYTTWLRPDPQHLPVVVAAALIPQRVDALHLVAGTREPLPGMPSHQQYQVPPADRSSLVVAFNAGFTMADSNGGWFGEGRLAARLVDGAASLVIRSDGRPQVGVWGADQRMGPDVVAVRQNLVLIVANGHPVDGLDANAFGRFGSSSSQYEYAWRSGIGTDPNGDLIYVAGAGLTLVTLADAMARSGITTGMELDIHTPLVTFNAFTPGPVPGQITGHKLLRSMDRPATRYLVPDQRDFFYATVR